jgi:hypothetical protein
MPKFRCRRARLSRIAVLLVAIAVTFATSAAVGLAATPAARAHAAGSLPLEGIFDSCSLNSSLTTCEQDLLQMHQAGLQVAVVSAAWDTPDEISTYASYAQSIGMSVMWELNDPGFWGGAWIGSSAAGDWPAFSAACGCTATTDVLNYLIGFLAGLPATYGYYAADDWTLTPSQKGGLKQYVSEIQGVDPNHMVMVGSSQGQGSTYYSSGATMGNEIYPVTTASLMPYGSNLATWDGVQQSAGQDQRLATRSGTQTAFILQAFTFGDNLDDGEAVGVCTAAMTPAHCASLLQYPSEAAQLELRNAVLLNSHPKLILWYTFAQASQGDTWNALTNVVNAPYPVSATAARARHTSRATREHPSRTTRKHPSRAPRKHPAHRRHHRHHRRDRHHRHDRRHRRRHAYGLAG